MAERRPTRPTPPPPPPPVPVVLPPGATEIDALLFQKLAAIEAQMNQQLTEMQRTMGGLIPLLETIIAHLEASAKKPEVPIASYEAMYEDHPIVAGPPEGELVAEGMPQTPEQPVGWWGRLFTKRVMS
jgi:hypothetical protein